MNSFADLLRKESNRFNNFVYSSKPYSCGINEAISYFKDFKIPKEDQYSIAREEKSTIIDIKPIKGSGKRKHYIITLWVS